MGQRIRALDGLRGLAALAVVAQHTGFMRVRTSGGFAVTIFFVLSGMLNARSLLSGEATGHFYFKRALRILPLYALVCAAILASDPPTSPHAALHLLTLTPDWIWLHTPHLTTSLLWSLGVEMQTYLVLPWLVRRRSTLNLFLVLAPAARIVILICSHWCQPFVGRAVYCLWICRVDDILWGSVAYFWLRDGSQWAQRISRLAPFVLPLALLACWYQAQSSGEFLLLQELFTITAISVVLWLETNPAPHWLSWPALQWCGVRCLGIYLLHAFPTYWLGEDPFRTVCITVVAAGLSWRWIESPLLSFGKRRLRRQPQSVPVLGLQVGGGSGD